MQSQICIVIFKVLFYFPLEILTTLVLSRFHSNVPPATPPTWSGKGMAGGLMQFGSFCTHSSPMTALHKCNTKSDADALYVFWGRKWLVHTKKMSCVWISCDPELDMRVHQTWITDFHFSRAFCVDLGLWRRGHIW